MSSRTKTTLYEDVRSALLNRDIGKIVDLIKSNPETKELIRSKSYFRSLLRSYYFPTIDDLGKNPIINWSYFNDWANLLFDVFSKDIQNFLSKRERIDSLILEEKSDEALLAISTLESELGISLWSLERKIIIDVSIKGIKPNESIFYEIISDSNISEEIKLVLSVILDRADVKKASFTTLKRMKESLADQFGEHYGKLLSYFYYKQILSTSEAAFATILCSKFNLIDYYESIVFLTSKDSSMSPRDWKKSINKILVDNDYRLRHLKTDPLLSLSSFNQEFITAVELYTRGDYKNLIQFCSVKNISKELDFLFLLIKGLARGSEFESNFTNSSLLKRLLKSTYDFINLSKENTNSAYDSLVAMLTVFNSFSLSDYIIEFLSEYVAIKDGQLKGIQFRKKLLSFRDFDRNELALTHYKELVLKRYPHLLTSRMFGVKWRGDIEKLEISSLDLPESRFLLNKLTYLIEIQKTEEIDVIIKHLESIQLHEIDKIKFRKLISKHLKLAGRFEELFSFLYKSYIDDMYSYFTLNYKQLLDEIYRNEINFDKSHPSYVKFLLTVNSFDPSLYFVLVKQGLRLFTKKMGIRKIDQLYEKLVSSREDVVFFEMLLRGNLMTFTGLASGSEELFDQKIQGYLFLKKLSGKDDVYDEIVKGLIEERVLESDVKKYDKEKIYVDVNGIIEGFDFNDAYQSVIDDKFSKPFVIKAPEGMELVIDTMFHKLLELVKVFLNEFNNNSKYGLTTSLSLGITHGVMENYIKSIIGEKKLLLSFDPIAEKVKIDDFWLMKDLYYEEKHIVDEVESAIKAFNEKISYLIRYFIRERLLVKVAREEGNFISMGHYAEYAQRFTLTIREGSDLDYQSFLQMFIDSFHEKLDLELEKVRKYLATDFKIEIQQIFKELNTKLDSVENREALKNIRSSVNSVENSLIDAVDKLEGWFYRRIGVSPWVESRNLKNVIQIAKTYHEKFINVSKKIEFKIEGEVSLQVLPQHTPHFVNIFFNLIQNTITYSNMPEDKIVFSVSVTKNEAGYIFEYSNPVYGDKTHNESIRLKLSQTIDRINDYSYLNYVAGDSRGTGIPKIEKILRFDIGGSGIQSININDQSFYLVFKVLENRFGS